MYKQSKEVFSELKACPYIELSISSPEFKWIRLSGKVVFSSNLEIKKAIVDKSELVKSVYTVAENLTFEVFYLEEAKAVLADFSSNPPMEYKL